MTAQSKKPTRRPHRPALKLGRALGEGLDLALAEFHNQPAGEQREQAAREGLKALELLIQHAGPILAHHRAVLAAEACEGGVDIDTWTGRDLEGDPEMMRTARIVTAQMLHTLPGLMPPAADEVLPLNLLTLNDGQARPFLTPPKRKKGGASQAELDRTAALRAMLWMRVGFDGVQKADMVRMFVELTGLSERTIERIAGRISNESDLHKSIGESRRAGKPDPLYCPLPIPTDDQIRQAAEYFKD